MATFTARFTNERGTVELEGRSNDETFRRLVVAEVVRLFAPNSAKPSCPAGDLAHGTRGEERRVVASVRSLMKTVHPDSGMGAATVFAYAATEAGRPGVTKANALAWADAVGFPQPADWSRTFNNAKRDGLIESAGHRYWAPTDEGRGYVLDALWIEEHRPKQRRRTKGVRRSPKTK